MLAKCLIYYEIINIACETGKCINMFFYSWHLNLRNCKQKTIKKEPPQSLLNQLKNYATDNDTRLNFNKCEKIVAICVVVTKLEY